MTRAGLTAVLLGSTLCCATSMAPADAFHVCVPICAFSGLRVQGVSTTCLRGSFGVRGAYLSIITEHVKSGGASSKDTLAHRRRCSPTRCALESFSTRISEFKKVARPTDRHTIGQAVPASLHAAFPVFARLNNRSSAPTGAEARRCAPACRAVQN
jgi:hypothetical protein